MRSPIKRLAALALCASALVVVAGCGSSERQQEASGGGDAGGKITLGISPFQDTLLPLVAERKGFFRDEGLDVELKSLGWDAIMPAVASGSIDAAINNTTGVISVANREPSVVYWYGFNPFTEGSALIGKKGSGLKSVDQLRAQGMSEDEAVRAAIEQLRGKTIVTTLDSDMGKAVDAALQSAGMSRKDVKLVDLNPDQGLAAFLAGKTGDAYLGGVPQRTKAVKEGFPVIASGPQLAPPPINGIVTKSGFARDNQDDLLKLMHALFRTVRYCNANTDDCAGIIVGELNRTTAAGLTNRDFIDIWQRVENFDGNAAEVQRSILDPSGYAYWKKTWDGDNAYLVDRQRSIPSAVDAATNFWADRVQRAYVARYGADEQGSASSGGS
jgi:ABC-type nitrate/sulfonate/bicarbonate transport system substrate-binding protein